MSTAAFLEDQDFFRFFGIFRNVTLKAIPDVHLEDVWSVSYTHLDVYKRQQLELLKKNQDTIQALKKNLIEDSRENN